MTQKNTAKNDKKSKSIDFLGLGAQKSGTSWVYACLYEHPEICAPIKEIHFFSRPRFEKGRDWYEGHFKKCIDEKLKGEFSTSYLCSNEAPGKIKEMYPDTKLIAILRNPIDRAYSQYGNAIKTGEIAESTSFVECRCKEKSVLEQGLYAEQLKRYLKYFRREQILVLVYEDIQKNPEKFMQSIYGFLGINSDFKASMLYKRVNAARLPKHYGLDRDMHHLAEFLRRHGLDKLVHLIRRTGLPDLVRKFNTKEKTQKELSEAERKYCREYFKEDVGELSRLLERNLTVEWNIQ